MLESKKLESLCSLPRVNLLKMETRTPLAAKGGLLRDREGFFLHDSVQVLAVQYVIIFADKWRIANLIHLLLMGVNG